MAAADGEARVDAALRDLLAAEAALTPEAVRARLALPAGPATAVQIAEVVLADFDPLLAAAESVP